MKTFRFFVMAALATFPFCMAGAQDDFGLWTEVSVSKALPHNLELSFEGEYRLAERLQQTDRLGGTLSLSYKATKFMKFQAGYAFLYSYHPEERKEKYTYDIVDPFFWEGYNLTEAYWSPRHRFKADVTFDKKFFKWLKVSLRERYQYTFRPEQEVPRMKYRFAPGNPDSKTSKSDPDVKHEKRTHKLRSRLELEYDKKKCDWGPFVSFEFYNDLQNKLKWDEYKVMAGSSYKISKRHKVKFAYLYNVEKEEQPFEARHVLVLGYDFKF